MEDEIIILRFIYGKKGWDAYKMFTVLMDQNKSLITPKRVTIYQGDNLMDTLRFVIPMVYNGKDITDYNVRIDYQLPGNVGCKEILVKSDEDCNDEYSCYFLPVNTQITKHAGDIKLSLYIYKYDLFENRKYQLHTGSLYIVVKPTDMVYEEIDSAGNEGCSNNNEFDVVEFSVPKEEEVIDEDFDVVEFSTKPPISDEDFEVVEF